MAEIGPQTTVLVNGQEVSVPANFYDLPVDQQNSIVDRTAQARGISKAPAYSGSMLPISTDQQGKITFPDWRAGLPATIAKSAWDSFTLPGDVASGAQPVLDPATGRTSPSLLDRSINLATTVNLTSPANIAARPSMLRPPTATQLVEAGGAGFDAARATGMELYGPSVGNLASGVKQQLASEARIPAAAPQTYALLDTLPIGRQAPMSLAEFQEIRSRLGDIARGADRQDAAAATIALKQLDEHLANLTPGQTVGGTATAQEVSDILNRARGNYAAGQRANVISGELDRATTGISERAEARAGATNSGANLDNALRQRVNAFLSQPGNLHGFSDAEIAMLQHVRDGTATQDTLRSIANLLGGGGGLGRLATAQTGGATGLLTGWLGGLDPVTSTAVGSLVPTVAGGITKLLENALARRGISAAEEAIRSRSPLHQERLSMQQPASELTARDAAVLRAMMPGLLMPPRPLSSDRQMPPGFI